MKFSNIKSALSPSWGFRVVAPDLRGFGASDSPAFGYGYDQMAGDLYNIVASLNLSSFALAGFSMGGAVALRYMRLYGGYGVKKLILFAAAAPCFVRRPDFSAGMSPKSGRRTDRPGEMRSARPHPRILSTAALRPPPWTAGNRLAGTQSPCPHPASARFGRRCSLRDEDGRADPESVNVPAFLLYGKKDSIVSNELAMTLYRSIRNAPPVLAGAVRPRDFLVTSWKI